MGRFHEPIGLLLIKSNSPIRTRLLVYSVDMLGLDHASLINFRGRPLMIWGGGNIRNEIYLFGLEKKNERKKKKCPSSKHCMQQCTPAHDLNSRFEWMNWFWFIALHDSLIQALKVVDPDKADKSSHTIIYIKQALFSRHLWGNLRDNVQSSMSKIKWNRWPFLSDTPSSSKRKLKKHWFCYTKYETSFDPSPLVNN